MEGKRGRLQAGNPVRGSMSFEQPILVSRRGGTATDSDGAEMVQRCCRDAASPMSERAGGRKVCRKRLNQIQCQPWKRSGQAGSQPASQPAVTNEQMNKGGAESYGWMCGHGVCWLWLGRCGKSGSMEPWSYGMRATAGHAHSLSLESSRLVRAEFISILPLIEPINACSITREWIPTRCSGTVIHGPSNSVLLPTSRLRSASCSGACIVLSLSCLVLSWCKY
jgi:hypothetical protein